MLGVRTQDPHDAFAPDDLALVAHFLHAGSDFHSKRLPDPSLGSCTLRLNGRRVRCAFLDASGDYTHGLGAIQAGLALSALN